jgi:hypothetical protein
MPFERSKSVGTTHVIHSGAQHSHPNSIQYHLIRLMYLVILLSLRIGSVHYFAEAPAGDMRGQRVGGCSGVGGNGADPTYPGQKRAATVCIRIQIARTMDICSRVFIIGISPHLASLLTLLPLNCP